MTTELGWKWVAKQLANCISYLTKLKLNSGAGL